MRVMNHDKHNDTTFAFPVLSIFRGLYQRVAAKLGVDPSYVSRVARGQRRSPEVVAALQQEMELIRRRLNQQDGLLLDSHTKDGELRNGRLHNGGLHDGGLHDGELHDGELHDGKLHDSEWRNGKSREGHVNDGELLDSALRNLALNDRQSSMSTGNAAKGNAAKDKPTKSVQEALRSNRDAKAAD
jgi:hypothetical protein